MGVAGTAVSVNVSVSLTGFSSISVLGVAVTLGANVGVGVSITGKVGITAVSADSRTHPTNKLPHKTAARTAVNFNLSVHTDLSVHIAWNCNTKGNED